MAEQMLLIATACGFIVFCNKMVKPDLDDLIVISLFTVIGMLLLTGAHFILDDFSVILVIKYTCVIAFACIITACGVDIRERPINILGLLLLVMAAS